jgi:hypothetical protein
MMGHVTLSSSGVRARVDDDLLVTRFPIKVDDDPRCSQCCDKLCGREQYSQ